MIRYGESEAAVFLPTGPTQHLQLVPLDEAAPVTELCDVDGCSRPAGFGHFALYCEPCSDLPYWAGPAALEGS